MHLDPIIVRRFSELAAKGEAVRAAKSVNFTDIEGKPHFVVPTHLFREWATNVLNLLHRVFGEQTPHYKNFQEHYDTFGGWLHDFENAYGVFKAAAEDFNGGYLFNVRTLAKAEVLADALTQAKELLTANYKDPACILARVALESALKDLAGKFGVPEAKLDKMNADLCKVGAYNMARQKQITAWAEIGNKAAHGEWSAYTVIDATGMVTGVENLVAEL